MIYVPPTSTGYCWLNCDNKISKLRKRVCLLLMSHSGPHFYLLQIQIEGKISPIIFLYTAIRGDSIRVGSSINLVEENSSPQSLFPCFIVWGLWSDKILYIWLSWQSHIYARYSTNLNCQLGFNLLAV